MRKNILISLLTLLLLNVQLLASGVDWTVNVHNYQYDMTAYVTLRLNGADVADLSSYTIAAFCNDECRGVMEARSVDNNTYGYLRIRSNQFSGEIITFKVYDPVSDRIVISTNQITFQSQQVIGYPSSPFVVEAMFQNWEPEFITICYGDSFAWDKSGKTYTESGVYTTIYDNAQATLHLTVLPEVPTTTEYATICHGETYTWNGQTYSTEGEYSVTLQNALGCDSVASLHLTIMPAAITTTETVVIGSDEIPYTWRGNTYTATGRYTIVEQYATIACDSAIHVLDLTVLNTDNYDEQSVTICETEAPYQWYGESYSATGKYTYTEKYAGTDIDSIQHILNLTVNPTVYTEETITACDSYTWNGETYIESGDYTYTTTAANGCDSIVTLHLTINQTKHAEESITACDSYTWNGETYIESGDYTYTTTAANGCDSIVTLHLTINQTKHAEESITACDSYTWNGETYTESGDYTYTTAAANGCDSIVTLHLTINQTKHAEESITACDSYTWNGVTYTESGEYIYTTTAANGCDSIVTLHLTINNTQYTEESVVACDSHTWNGETYTTSGDYVYTTTASNGCDSIVTLHLTINNSEVSAPEYATICHGETYTWNGQTYSTEGEYSVTLQNALGCDSVASLHLTIMPAAITTTETVVIGSDEIPYTWRGNTYSATGRYTVVEQYATIACDSAIHVLDLTVLNTDNYDEQSVTICDTEAPYQWYGESYSTTGKYTYTEPYAGTDIDSVQHILNLTVNPTKYAEESITACDSYTWNGETYTESGDYVYTTTATNGCDSIVTLHLTINQTKHAEESITACDSYTWNGETYTESGDYVYTTTATNGCDSIVTLHLTINQTKHAEESITACDGYTWNGETYTESGDYVYTTVAANGCDSIVTLHLTINYSEVSAPEYATICHGETYTWNGQTYSTEGEYSVTLQNALGCDSVASLHLTIMPAAITTTETVVIGSDEIPYTWRGNTYSATGRYTVVEQYATIACDSAIHVLDLTVLNTDNYDEQSVTICDTEAPYQWYGESYSTTGKYTYTEPYAGTDIDSVQHILNLTVNPTKYAEESITACDSYTWNGETYTESGDYVYTTTATNGCDSIVTLHLTINKSEYIEEIATTCDSYEWNGLRYTESGDYTYTTITDHGCDRVEVLHLTILPEAIAETEILALCPSELPYEWYGQSLTEAGLYTVTEQYSGMSCDSIIHELTLNIFVQTLPEQLTLPIVQPGKPIDVTIPTEEILAYIAAQTWYAPNAWVVWYVKEGAEWGPLTTEPVSSAASNIVLKYAVETDCDIVESPAMTIIIEPTSVDAIQSGEIEIYKIIRNDKVWIIRNGEMYNTVGVKVTEVR